MKSALDVAKYYLCLVDREAGDTISNLKLQKLVYYAQAWSLVLRGEPLYDEQIQAWMHGPVVPVVYYSYRKHGSSSIPHPTDFDGIETFSSDEIEVLDEVWRAYGDLSGTALRNLTHQETPWLKARVGLEEGDASDRPIDLQEMKEYYSQFAS